MDNQQLDLGRISTLSAESFGEPGQRTFRVRAETPEASVSLWLEKEQIVMLGSAVGELLERVPDTAGDDPTSDIVRTFIGDLEVRAGSLAVGYDSELDGFTLQAADFVSDFDISGIHLLADRRQFAQIGEQIDKIVTAGRPRCSLCGTPLTDGPHFCPQSNGHGRLARPG